MISLHSCNLPVNTAIIPQELKELPQWVLWKRERRDGELTKIPYSVRGMKAKANDRSAWASFEPCIHAMVGYDGVGFEFCKEDGITGIDFDDCRDPKDGTIEPHLLEWIKRFNSYSEISDSDTGLHIFVRGNIHGKRRRKGNVEMYDDGRFFVMTGASLPATPPTIEPRQEELNAFYREKFGDNSDAADSRPANQIDTSLSAAVTTHDGDVIKKASLAKNGGKFRRLFFDGDKSDYTDDDSRADLALCGLLRFWCRDDRSQIDRIFRRSALFRAKWDERHGAETYGEMTIAKTMALDIETYEPDYGASGEGEAYNAPWERELLYRHDPDATNAIVNGQPKTDRELKLPKINEVIAPIGISTIEELHAVFKCHLHIEEDYNIDGPVCAVLSAFLVDESDIIGLVGHPVRSRRKSCAPLVRPKISFVILFQALPSTLLSPA